MTYSYTQISQYLGCPRRYRHRYLDRWQEKDKRAPMIFGRVFEKALAAFFHRQEERSVSQICELLLRKGVEAYKQEGPKYLRSSQTGSRKLPS